MSEALHDDGQPRCSRQPICGDGGHVPRASFPWNTDWYLKEAKKHQISGVVHLISVSGTQPVRGSYFIKKTHDDSGIPVLGLRADTVDARAWDDGRITAEIEAFLEKRLGVNP